jgi:hypothetical protein
MTVAGHPVVLGIRVRVTAVELAAHLRGFSIDEKGVEK